MNNSSNDLIKIFNFSMQINLQLIVAFHNEQLRLMKNQVVEIKENLNSCKDNDERKGLICEKEIYINTYEKMLRINTFLMMYSHLEEFLYHIWKIFNKELIVSGNGLARFKIVIENVLGVDLSRDNEWKLLGNFEKVRNCLLHANGRIDLLKNENSKNNIESIIKESDNLLTKKKDRIEVSGEYLKIVQITIESLFKRLEKVKIE